MTPYEHSQLSVFYFGGKEEDYIEIHKFLDQTKFMLPNMSHRFFLHNTLGIKLCEDFFGDAIVNSDDLPISVREIARRHITEDLGKVPTLQEWIDGITNKKPWIVQINKEALNKLHDINRRIKKGFQSNS